MKILAAATLAATLLTTASATAAEVYNVQAWINTPASQGANTADLAHYNLLAATQASAVFTWTGPINWFDTGAQNNTPAGGIASNFFSDNGTLPTNFADHAVYNTGASALSEAAFLASSLTQAGDPYSTFYRITTTYTAAAATVVNFSHDDGASVYLDGSLAPLPSTTASETSVVTEAVTLAAGTHNLELFYVSGNGTPSVLTFSTPGGVPEPASWALMIAGFGGVGAALRGRRQATASATA